MDLHDSHYVRAVTELSETSEIVTHRDVFAENGIKVVAAGIQLNLKLYDQLVKHKLTPPLDLCLSIKDSVDHAQLIDDWEALVETSPHAALLKKLCGTGDSHRQTMLNIPLPPPLSFKLTVAKRQRPRIYHRSLLVTKLSIFLARAEDFSVEQEQEVATAALFHEVGMLHIDPEILEPTHEMTPEERQHLYTHPLTAYLLLQKIPEISPAAANAVLEHHEHMDGSGYPRHLHGKSISRYGQILGISQVIARAFDPENPLGQWKQLEMMLRLNMRRYGPDLIGHLGPIFNHVEPAPQNGGHSPREVAAKVQLVGNIFGVLEKMKEHNGHDQAMQFALERGANLAHGLLSAGFDYRQPEAMALWLESDLSLSEDFMAMTSETLWQFNTLLQEIAQRWPPAANTTWLGEIRASLEAA